MSAESVIKIAAKLYDCRDTARRLLGEKYAPTMTQFAGFVRSHAKPDETLLSTATRIGRSGVLDGMQTVLMLAAVVEAEEPT